MQLETIKKLIYMNSIIYIQELKCVKETKPSHKLTDF